MTQSTDHTPTRKLDRRAFLTATGGLATTVGYASPTSADTTQQDRNVKRHGWTSVYANEHNTSTVPYTGPTTLNTGWSTSFGTGITGFPVCYDGEVYLPLGDEMVALAATDGTERWRHTLPGDSSASFAATEQYVIAGVWLDAERVNPITDTTGEVIGSVIDNSTGRGGMVHAIKRSTGETAWTRQLRSSLQSSPTPANGRIYIGDEGGTVYALSETDGSVEWTNEGESISGSPTSVADGTVFAQSRQGVVRALDERTGERRWTTELTFNNHPTPVVRDGLVITGGYLNEGSNLFALDAASGQRRWKRSFQGSMVRPPAVTADRVFIQTERYVHALDRATGTTRWKTASDGLGGVAVATNVVYAMSARSVRALDPTTGEEIARNTEHKGHDKAPVFSSEQLIVATDDGTLRSLGPYEMDSLERTVGIAAGGVGLTGAGYLGYRHLRGRETSKE